MKRTFGDFVVMLVTQNENNDTEMTRAEFQRALVQYMDGLGKRLHNVNTNKRGSVDEEDFKKRLEKTLQTVKILQKILKSQSKDDKRESALNREDFENKVLNTAKSLSQWQRVITGKIASETKVDRTKELQTIKSTIQTLAHGVGSLIHYADEVETRVRGRL